MVMYSFIAIVRRYFMKNRKVLSLISLLICIIMLALSFTACSSLAKRSGKSSRSRGRYEDDDDEDDEDEDDEGDEDDEDEGDEDDDDYYEGDDGFSDYSSIGAFEIEEQVVYDGNDIKITATGALSDAYSQGIEFLIENNTDSDVEFYVESLYVNDCYISSYLDNNRVTAGSKAYSRIYIYYDQLYEYGIKSIGNIDILIDGWDSATYNSVMYADINLKTNLKPDKPKLGGDIPVYNKDGLTINASYGTDYYGTKSIILYCENNSKKDIYVSVRSFDINGFSMDGYVWLDLNAGKYGIGTIYIYESSLDANHIDEIEEIVFSLDIQDASNYMDSVTTDKITIEVE